LKITLDLLARSSKGQYLIKFLASQPRRKASLPDVCKHVYGNRDKKSFENWYPFTDRTFYTVIS